VTEEELKSDMLQAADEFSDEIYNQIADLASEMWDEDESARGSTISLMAGRISTKLGALSLALGDLYSSSKAGLDMEQRSQLLYSDIIGLAREARNQMGHTVPKDMQ
jgi:hypothetical protein